MIENAAPTMIKVRNLTKVFYQAGTGNAVQAIEHLDFEIAAGEIVAIVGQTGCGKSTFFDMLIGLDAPTGGSVEIDGRSPYNDFDYFQGRIATVFQQDRLLPWRSAVDNVRLGLEFLALPMEEQQTRARTWLGKLGLHRFLDAYPHELSGGMRQRVAIARAFAVQANILLADEAFGHLDEVTAIQLRQDFADLAHASGATAILITHQIEEALSVGSRVLVFGRPATILADIRPASWPTHEWGTLRKAILATLQNNAPHPDLVQARESATG